MASKKERITTPVGTLKWAYLSEPNTRWKDDGEFSVTLVLPEGHAFLEQLDKLADDGFTTVKKTLKPKDAQAAELAAPYSPEYDAEDNATGNVEIRCKTAAFFVDKKTGNKISLKPKLFDAGGKLIKGKLIVGNGSKGAINCSYGCSYIPSAKKVYLSLYLNAVQILELVEYDANASQFGFGKQEGGFDASTLAPKEETFADQEGTEGDF